ncbi:hypothetical protein E0H22_20165 [Rhodopseudomonas boonkerdii]|uniref:hypothetical protein n=1 Tax=Rhodopseudomonas boonkerdii TaxID=475937 RepID=UPI001E4C6D77|nr:hypothetical protein [Rhodopseudomonas boonkerdii]UGV27786.1 hypothetical protein E0H22_20165 [Rhodopseudomonas boonkerdii]
MSMTALQPVQDNLLDWKSASTGFPASADTLAAANINPRTGLATDYLNHFNEAIMLLELIPDMPDCYELFLEWQPLSYAEHFIRSNFKGRDLAVAAYEAAPSAVRTEFDAIVAKMMQILSTVGDAMRTVQHDATRARLAEQAARWVKPMIGTAGGIINGRDEQSDIDSIMAQ